MRAKIISEFEREMQLLEAGLKRLEAEYNMFFAGRLPRLPWEARSRVERLIKQYDRMATKNTAERFRFNTLQARFVKFCELWERNLKAREEGRPLAARHRKTVATSHSSRAAAKHEKSEHLVHVAAVKDPTKQTDRVAELYAQLCEARKQAGEREIPFQQFAAVVRAQVTKHADRDHAASFRVAVKEGKVMLTVKRVKDGE